MKENARTLGARIAAARESSGLTQMDLSQMSGIERSALAKIERGLRGVSALELAALAGALDVRLEWLLSDPPVAVASHRARADAGLRLSTIDRELERIARDVEFVAELYAELLGRALEPVDVPTDGAAAEELAAEARVGCDLPPDSPILDLVGSVAQVGLLVFAMPLGAETADAATTLLIRGGVSLVNSTHQVGRRRLALTHEFGHYLVADDYTVDWRVAEQKDADHVEGLIDRFARAFLAPPTGLRAFWGEASAAHDTRTAAVLAASHFRIDMSTLARRLAELGLADRRECASIRGARTTRTDIIEHNLVIPYDLEGVALPRTYEKAVLAQYRAERISAERTLALLRGSLEVGDLPALPPRHHNEIWSVLS